MAVGIKVELPTFLHRESLEYDINRRAESTLQKRGVKVADVPTDIYQNLFTVIERDSVAALAKQDIRWEFGDTHCLLLNPTDADIKANADVLTDRMIEAVDSAVGTTIYITMAALSSLALKGFKQQR